MLVFPPGKRELGVYKNEPGNNPLRALMPWGHFLSSNQHLLRIFLAESMQGIRAIFGTEIRFIPLFLADAWRVIPEAYSWQEYHAELGVFHTRKALISPLTTKKETLPILQDIQSTESLCQPLEKPNGC